MSPTDELIRRFARGEAEREDNAAIVRAALLEAPSEELPAEPAPAPAVYEPAFAGALAAAAGLDRRTGAARRRARELTAQLVALPPAQRPAAIEGDERFHTWELVEALREASHAAGPEDPGESRLLARLAAAAAGRVPAAEPDGERLAADLRALALAQLGNAERVASDLRAAESAFAAAEGELTAGTGDPLPRARYLSLLASLRSDQSRFAEAVELAGRAAGLYRRAGDAHQYGRTLLKLATLHSYRDQPEAALGRLDAALAHLDPEREPRLVFAVRHNRASALERAGRLDEAAAELAVAAELASGAVDRVRTAWLAGRIAVARGDEAGGERELLAARQAFVERRLGYEAAQVSLELAALYAAQGRAADQRRLAEEMVPLFSARDVHREARAALVLFCDAVRAEAASANLAREIAAYLDRARDRPELAFRRGHG